MISALLSVLLGILVVVAITALTGYFVAQEFGYMAVDRGRLRSRAAAGDAGAGRALAVTDRTSFMLSGAQLGITVTGLLVGYVAEPLVGAGLGTLLGGVGVPAGAGVAVGAVVALVVATVVQMVFGELFPKNLAIARPEPVARRLARSTAVYLRLFGWLIHLFDAASNLLLRALRIEPVHDVEHAATPRDLEAIIDASRAAGALDAELSVLLDRGLDFADRTARSAMIPRPRVVTVGADASLAELTGLLAAGRSRLPVLGTGADDVVGVVGLRDVLAFAGDPAAVTAGDLARPPVAVPASLPLPAVLHALRAAGEELACVVDEYGGLAGVITTEDVAEELIGEITDERDGGAEPVADHHGWTVEGGLDIDELERVLGAPVPRGEYRTVGGLVMAALQRLPEDGDVIEVAGWHLTVTRVERRVPALVRVRAGGPA